MDESTVIGGSVRRAALYMRVSTHDQSCDNQLPELRRYVEARGWTIFKEYVDEGVSGTKDFCGSGAGAGSRQTAGTPPAGTANLWRSAGADGSWGGGAVGLLQIDCCTATDSGTGSCRGTNPSGAGVTFAPDLLLARGRD